MKFKLSFLLIIILLVSISIPLVFADENVTENSDDSVDLKLITSDSKVITECGGDVEINVTAINAGSNTAHNTQVKSIIPEGLSYSDSEVSKGSFNKNTGTWKIGDLKPSETANLKLIAKAITPGDYSFEFSIYSDCKDVDETNNHAIANLNVKIYQGPASADDDIRDSDVSYYFTSDYSDFREVTKSINITAEAKLEKKPTANPIMLGLLSITALIAIASKKRF